MLWWLLAKISNLPQINCFMPQVKLALSTLKNCTVFCKEPAVPLIVWDTRFEQGGPLPKSHHIAPDCVRYQIRTGGTSAKEPPQFRTYAKRWYTLSCLYFCISGTHHTPTWCQRYWSQVIEIIRRSQKLKYFDLDYRLIKSLFLFLQEVLHSTVNQPTLWRYFPLGSFINRFNLYFSRPL